jgi:membrane-associated phospholipid phosphatase
MLQSFKPFTSAEQLCRVGAASRATLMARYVRVTLGTEPGDDPVAVADFVTDFADQAVLLPLAIAITFVLAYAGWRRGAFAWVIAISGALGLMLALKLVFTACAQLLPGVPLHSPSGHAAAAGVVYGSLFALVARLLSGHSGWNLPCAIIVVAVIGLSRLILGVHTLLEVGVGGFIGIMGAMAFARLAGPPPAGFRPSRAAAVALLVIVVFHGARLPAEAAIRGVAVDLWPLSECRR